MTSTAGSKPQSAIRRVTLFTRGDVEMDAARVLHAVGKEHGVEPVGVDEDPDLAVVLGGDGTMLKALKHYLGANVPVLGVNFGRVGYLTAMEADEMEAGLARVFEGDFRTIRLSTLELEVDGAHHVAVNDVVFTSSTLGRMVELGWSIGGEDLGVVGCDGIVCSTPSGSTAYNLSNGGPVLVWGLEAMAVTLVAPHSLKVRPLVVPRGLDLAITNETTHSGLTVLVDGVAVGELGPAMRATVRLGDQVTLLATLPESTFFSRYREHFAS
jgi:NAD+ kinase